MGLRVTALGTLMAVGVLASACSGANVSIGSDGKQPLQLSEVKKSAGTCQPGTKHPNICCKGEKCYSWVDDPFRACEFGYESINDGSKCCHESDAKKCVDPEPPAPPPPQPPLPASEQVCLRAPANLAPSPELHVIGVYQPRDSKKPIEVTIAKTATPVTVVLSSYESATWHFNLEAGASVAQVLIYSYDLPNAKATGLPAGTPIVHGGYAGGGYGWEVSANTGGTSFRTTIDEVRRRFNGTETSYQGIYDGTEFRVPFSEESLAKVAQSPEPGGYEISHYRFDQQSCADKCAVQNPAGGFWAGGTAPFDKFKVEENGFAVRADGTGPWAVAQSAKKVRCGKHYFELDVVKGSPTSSWTFLGVGFAAGAVGHPYPLSHPDLASQMVRSETNETIGVLLDMDAAHVYFRTANGWRAPGIAPFNADAAAGGALNLWTYHDVIVTAELQDTDLVRYRGAAPFTYEIPAGYSAGLE